MDTAWSASAAMESANRAVVPLFPTSMGSFITLIFPPVPCTIRVPFSSSIIAPSDRQACMAESASADLSRLVMFDTPSASDARKIARIEWDFEAGIETFPLGLDPDDVIFICRIIA
jgi:hypothetical protein